MGPPIEFPIEVTRLAFLVVSFEVIFEFKREFANAAELFGDVITFEF